MALLEFDPFAFICENAISDCGPAKVAKDANVLPIWTVANEKLAGLATLADGHSESEKLEECQRGVASLTKHPPRDANLPTAWPLILSDAFRLIDGGWAAQALALGWTTHDLFSAARGSDYGNGLAIWLQGRSLALIDVSGAMVKTGNGYAYVHRRHHVQDRVLLWEIGRQLP